MQEEESTILDSDEGEEAPKPKRENSTIRQMREALEAKESELAAATERANKYEASFLSNSGLTEKQANVFKAAGYEATPEGIDSFRSEVLGIAAEEAQSEQSEEAEEPDDITAEQAGFAPTPTGGQAPRGKREVTSQELLKIYETDPVKADKLIREGRVTRQEFNPGGPRF